jgi:iron-sulfur cluster assembly protein
MEETTITQFPVRVTDRAMAQVRRLLAKDGRPEAFLRLGVKGGGCSGFEYVMKLDTARKPIDLEMEAEGVRIVCDAKSAVYLSGSTFDYTGNLIGGGFKFDNPNVARSCGCGTSFTPRTAAGA